jgi:hypothetical protein
MTIDPLDGYPAMMSSAEVAEYMGVGKARLAQWRHRGGGPPYVKMNPAQQGLVRYPREDLRSWLAARRMGDSSEPQAVAS